MITTADPPEILSDWTNNIDHLFNQLKFILCECSTGGFISNIESAIIKALNYPSLFKSIGEDRHIYGRLISKLSNNVLLLFTDGGKISNFNSLKTTEKIQNLLTEKDNLFSHLYQWDYSFYSFILNGPPVSDLFSKFNSNENSLNKNKNKNKLSNTYSVLRKYTKMISGEIFLIESFDDLYIKVDDLVTRKCFFNFVNLKLEMSPALISKIKLQQENCENSFNQKVRKIK